MPPGTEQTRVATQYLLARVASDARERIIDVNDRSIRPGDQDPFPGVRKYTRRQVQLLFRSLALRNVAKDRVDVGYAIELNYRCRHQSPKQITVLFP